MAPQSMNMSYKSKDTHISRKLKFDIKNNRKKCNDMNSERTRINEGLFQLYIH